MAKLNVGATLTSQDSGKVWKVVAITEDRTKFAAEHKVGAGASVVAHFPLPFEIDGVMYE